MKVDYYSECSKCGKRKFMGYYTISSKNTDWSRKIKISKYVLTGILH